MNVTKYAPLIAVLFLAGCGSDSEESDSKQAKSQAAPAPSAQGSSPASPEPTRQGSFDQVRRGATLYQQNCAQCHGDKGQGAPNWQQRGPDGKYPAPPLNGTGHTWHHPMQALRQTIKNGTERIGGNMPGWKDKLSDQEIDAIIYWFQSKWPDELYVAWAEADRRKRQGN